MPRVEPPPLRAAALVAWGNAFLTGASDPDTASEAARGADRSHWVANLPGAPDDMTTLPVALRILLRDGALGFRLVLPVAGDPYGLPGPPDFNANAILAGETVLVSGLDIGLVPEVRRSADAFVDVTWHSCVVESRPSPLPSMREADRTLSAVLRESTELLSSLDVARLDEDATEVLVALRRGAFDGPRLPPGHPPTAADIVVRARRLGAIVSLARNDDGGALTAGEAAQRRAALLPLDRAARQALSAAYSVGAE